MTSITLAALAAITFVPAPPAQAKPDDLARQAAEQFCKAVKAESLDQIMKIVDVPWFHDGKMVIRKREELKQQFAEIFQEKEFDKLTFEITAVHRFGAVKNEANEKERELLKGVLDDDDRIVLLQINVNGKKADTVKLAVRIRKGVAKVVGLRD